MILTDLVRMANQIAVNQAHLPDDEATEIVATHIASFWTPKMRRELAEAVADGRADLNEVARHAIEQLQPA